MRVQHQIYIVTFGDKHYSDLYSKFTIYAIMMLLRDLLYHCCLSDLNPTMTPWTWWYRGLRHACWERAILVELTAHICRDPNIHFIKTLTVFLISTLPVHFKALLLFAFFKPVELGLLIVWSKMLASRNAIVIVLFPQSGDFFPIVSY